ncbi:unnamed protein product, partial [marine sediment metagenome]
MKKSLITIILIFLPLVVFADSTSFGPEILFEDKIKFTQVDGNEYIDSGLDGWVNIGATIGIEMNAPTWAMGELTTAGEAIFNSSSLDVDFTVNWDTGVGLFVQGSDGYVGIGTASPDQPLEITGSAAIHLNGDGQAMIEIDRSDVGKRSEIRFQTADSTQWVVGLADSDNLGDGSEFFIGQSAGGASSTLVLETTGNVGIGVADPHSTLEVNGAI